jgi:hypothetical protein
VTSSTSEAPTAYNAKLPIPKTPKELHAMPEAPQDNSNQSFDELMKKADKGELSQNDMDTILQDYAKAVREEFEIATAARPDNAEEAARDFARKHQGESLAQIHWLSIHADSESVKLNASKYIVSLAISESNAEGDPIKQIMANLMGPQEQESTTS